jgi:WD40 repeat protein
MTLRNVAISCLLLFLSLRAGHAQPAIFPRDPLLQLQSDGPTAAVQALAFGPRGETLYCAGYDKVVHAWRRTGSGTFVHQQSYRVPVGPAEGLLNALAVSPDGRWLAVAGLGLFRDAAGFRQSGFLMPRGALKADALEDQGTIYLFDTTGAVPVRPLTGHRGPVLSMIFTLGRTDKAALLVSASQEHEASPFKCRLRLWDAASGESLQRSGPFDTNPRGQRDGRRPALAAWRTGPGERDLAVAVGIRDQPLRVWDVAGKSLNALEKAPVGSFNRPVAFLRDKGSATGASLVSGFVNGGGKLGRWLIRGKEELKPNGEPAPVHKEGACAAVTVLPGQRGAARALAAVVYFPKEGAFRLFVFTQHTRPLQPVRPEGLPLWKGDSVPAIAASPDGQYVAVASTPANEVRVYRAAELLAGGPASPMTLRSDGILIEHVEFARIGKDRGLLLRAVAPDGTMVLEFGRGLTGGPGSAKRETPAGSAEWALEDGKDGLTLKGPGFAMPLPMAPGRVVTARAVLPRARPRLPLLAIAYVEGNVHHLGLFDADQGGKQVRQFSGHADRINSLAFDCDGRLLASSSDDKTVSLWSLTDLDQHLGRHGTLLGLTVGAGLSIVRLNAEQLSEPNRAALRKADVKEGDVVAGIAGPGAASRPRSPLAFYDALFQLQPGKPVTLQIAGKGNVTLTLDQGIDDQKPLVTFFFRRDAAGHRQWLAWSPHGPYDASDLDALEKRIAWHVNPPNPRQPVELHNAGKYRREYHRKGIVPKLVRHANREDALRELLREPAPRPDMSLQLDGIDLGDQRDERNNAVVQQVPRTLRARVENIEPWRVEKVNWRVNGGEPQAFANAGDQVYTVDLTKQKWRRGLYTFELVVTTTDLAEHVSQPPLVLHFQPPAPKVRFPADWLRTVGGSVRGVVRVVKEEELLVRGEAEPEKLDGVDTPRVRLLLRHNGAEVARTEYAAGAKVTGEWKVKLKEGANEFVVTAENEGAPPGSPFERASTERLVIDYRPAPPPEPTIELEAVRPESGDEVSLLPKAPDVVAVAAPRARVLGRIVTAAPLADATLDGRPLRGFDRKKKLEVDPKTKLQIFPIDEVVDLKPGRRTLSFRTAAERGKPVAPRTLTLAFHPELPRVHPSQPRRLDLEANDRPTDPREYTLRVQLAPPPYPFDYRAGFRLNGDKKLLPAAVDKEDHTLTGRLTLRPGTNTVHVILLNEYRGRVEEELTIKVPRPPAILSLKGKQQVDRAEATLDASVRSAEGLPLRGFRVRVNGEPQATVKQELRRDPDDATLWASRLANVRLREGANTVEVQALNVEGQSKSRSFEIVYKPIVLPPRIVRVHPVQVSPVHEPEFRLEFRVESARGAEPVLLLNDRPVKLPAPEKVDGASVYRLPVSGLKVGPNDVEIRCADARHRLSVSYTPRWTARLHFGELERPDARGKRFPREEGAPTGHVWLHGYVEYRDAEAMREHQGGMLECLVNDFLQLDPEVVQEKPKELRRYFRLNLRLNREKNQVVVKLPDALKLEGNKTEEAVELRCRKPEKDQQLHLMVLGPGQPAPQKLVARVLKAFQATEVKGNRFATRVFKRGILYGPFPSYLTPEMVFGGLKSIRAKLQPADSPLNDVILVYFAGEEKVVNGKHYLLTKAAKASGDMAEAIDVDKLRAQLQQTRGAKLLLLDTQGSTPGGGAPLSPGASPRVGLYRYVWLGEGPAPEKDRLVQALQDTLRKAPLVREQREPLERWAASRPSRTEFSLTVPPGLEALELSEKESK